MIEGKTLMKEKMNQFERYCTQFPAFTPNYCLFRSYMAQIEAMTKKQSMSKEADDFLKSGINLAQSLGQKVVEKYIMVSTLLKSFKSN